MNITILRGIKEEKRERKLVEDCDMYGSSKGQGVPSWQASKKEE